MTSNTSFTFLKDEQYLSVNATFVVKYVRKKTIHVIVHTGVSDLPRSTETPDNYYEY